MIARRMFNLPTVGLPTAGWRNPFAEMERMSRQMDLLSRAMLGRPGLRMIPSRVYPAVNITEDRDKYYVRTELPGLKSEDVDLQLNGRTLTISGERKIRFEGENIRYHRREREAGKFSRAIELPADIDRDKIDAKMINGVLMVELPKSEAAKPRQITVH